MPDLYANYAALKAAEVEGVDYHINTLHPSGKKTLMLSIHGGRLEAGSGELARAVAGTEMLYYEFVCTKSAGLNQNLHVTSTNFDEPRALAMVAQAERCVSFHGFSGNAGEPVSAIGGLDAGLRRRVIDSLTSFGFYAIDATSGAAPDFEYPGTDPQNICNKTTQGMGVQIELSNAQRAQFFTGGSTSFASQDGPRTARFYDYVQAIKEALVDDFAPPLADLGLPADEVIDALIAGIVRIRRRVEIYESDGTTPWDAPYWNARLVDGQVTVDRERDERRMCDITLENNDNALKIDPYNGFWYDKILKVFWGIRYFDSSGRERLWETQIGEFMIDQITENRFPNAVKVTGRDYAKKCLSSKLKTSLSFDQYTPIEQIITAMAANCGITKFAMPYTGQGFAQDVIFERGTERWSVMKQLADSIGYELYFRGDGYLTMRPYGDPTMSPLMWIFNQSALDGTLVDYERTTNDSRIKNHIIVTGSTTTNLDGLSSTAFAEAINVDPQSPTRVSRIGDRVEIIESDYITTKQQAEDMAATRLRIAALEEFSINFSSVIIPWLDGGDIVGIREPDESEFVPTRFLLANFTFPLALGVMSGTGRRVTIVGTTTSTEFQ